MCSYFYWSLFWGEEGGLVTLDFPWQANPGYTINPIYYAFKQSEIRDEGISFSRRLARAGKLVGHMNHLGTTHAMHIYTPIFDASDVTELSAKLVTAFALRGH